MGRQSIAELSICIKFSYTHLYTWIEKGSIYIYTHCPYARQLDTAESIALTIKPPRLNSEIMSMSENNRYSSLKISALKDKLMKNLSGTGVGLTLGNERSRFEP